MADTFAVELKVTMPCEGCVGAVRRVLERREGVRSVDIDLKSQKVVIQAQAPETREGLKEVVAKTGKATEFWA